MPFHADLHVHSKFSRATSRDLDFEHLAWWAARKGLAVVGTGDCVHPGWLAEIRDKLIPDGDGLLRLRPEIESALGETLPPSCRHSVRFLLSTEIATIYKKGEKTRKIHHLVIVETLDAAERLAARLARVGNIASDGRPILGLDSRDLLEIVLDSDERSWLVPAHVWTPWFAALGSQSGFDSIEECYGDLAKHIFAVETGLSSDPAMNWRVSSLDRFRLTSSSDAHSPGKLGREATCFSCAVAASAIRHALETGEGYQGTVEFFPEEGKYHLDGHRACGVRLSPPETLALGGRCPACGGRVTVGVAHRVEMLADRAEAGAAPPPTAGSVASLVPLAEILSEIIGTGVGSGAVVRAYDHVTAVLGPELPVLQAVPIEAIARLDARLGEAIARLRAGAVIREAGYDGEYGVIRLFRPGELEPARSGGLLFEAPLHRRVRAPKPQATATAAVEAAPSATPAAPVASRREGVLAALDDDQALAAALVEGKLAIIAGPGAGKTRMLTHRIAHLVRECGVAPGRCLAITFTRRATEELRSRLLALLPGRAGAEVVVHSFHSLGLAILRADGAALGLAGDFRIADDVERKAALAACLGITASRAEALLKAVSVLKRTHAAPAPEEGAALAALDRLGREGNWLDFDDLIGRAVDLLERDAAVATRWRARFTHVLADEFQDVDESQYRLLGHLVGAAGNLCVIGDPNQAIYGFRGADATCFQRFAADHPAAGCTRLVRNYRSIGTIVTASARVVGAAPEGIIRPMGEPIAVHAAANEGAEAADVAATIEALLGGHDMLAAHRDRRAGMGAATGLGFADFAVLYRTDAQSGALAEAFDRAGIPFRKSSPAPLSAHAGMQGVLAALAADEPALAGADLPARLAAAAEAARRMEGADTVALAEARGWLLALAASPKVAGQEALLREQVALSIEADFYDARADRVSLLTMHAAKGLEFAVVFVVGMEAGLVPYGGGEQPDDEERRLFYVAMTRARDRLFLSRCVTRFWRGALRSLPASPFLDDLPRELTTTEAPAARRRRRAERQLSLF